MAKWWNGKDGFTIKLKIFSNSLKEPELYNELYNYPPSLGELRQDHIEGNQHNGSWFDTDLWNYPKTKRRLFDDLLCI